MNVRRGRLKGHRAVRRIRTALGAGAVAALVLSTASCSDVFGTRNDIEILWPTRNATLYDLEVLRARVPGRHLDDYEIYWYVDDSREERMWNDWDDRTPHKAFEVDTWYWDWYGSGPYTVGFIAEDYSGRVIARRTVRVYVR